MSAEVIHYPVLVLNKRWLAVHICTVKRAISLLYQRLALVVTEEYEVYDFDSWLSLSQFARNNEPMIRTPQFEMRAPKVIVLGHYQNSPPRTVRFNRRNIFQRDNHQCQYCGVKPPREELTIDHVNPRSRGGKSTWENVVVACVRCNTRKGNRLTTECGMTPRTKPRRPNWLATVRFAPNSTDRTVWEQFIDKAYWEVDLIE